MVGLIEFKKDRLTWKLNRWMKRTTRWFYDAGMKKITAIVTVTCFVFTSVIGQTAHAIATRTDESVRQVSSISDFVIPYTAGRITDAKCFDESSKVVINIQDLHCHAEVQKNISKILSLLDERYNINKVYLEGAIGKVDTSWLTSIEDKNLKKDIVESLVNQGKLTGAEYYSVQSDKPGLITGIETENIYKQNLIRLNKILAQKPELENVFKSMSAKIDDLKKTYYSSKQHKLESLVNDYKNNEITAEKFYAKLQKQAKALNIDTSDYKNTEAFIKLLEVQKELKYKKVGKELEQYVSVLKQKLPYNVYKVLAEKLSDYSKLDEAYVYLARIVQSSGSRVQSLETFPELAKFFEYVNLSQKINPIDLVREEDILTREMFTALSTKEREKDVVFLTSFFKFVKNFYENKITADDYDYFVKNEKRFDLLWEKYTKDEGRKTRDEEIANDVNKEYKSLKQYSGLMNEYYKTNLERNYCFMNNCLGASGDVKGSDVFISKYADQIAATVNSLGKAEISIVITGGFHTSGLKKLLENRKISYLVITPNVTQDAAKAEEVYNKIARIQANFLNQTLALMILTQDPTNPKALTALMSWINFEVQKNGSIESAIKDLNKLLKTEKFQKWAESQQLFAEHLAIVNKQQLDALYKSEPLYYNKENNTISVKTINGNQPVAKYSKSNGVEVVESNKLSVLTTSDSYAFYNYLEKSGFLNEYVELKLTGTNGAAIAKAFERKAQIENVFKNMDHSERRQYTAPKLTDERRNYVKLEIAPKFEDIHENMFLEKHAAYFEPTKSGQMILGINFVEAIQAFSIALGSDKTNINEQYIANLIASGKTYLALKASRIVLQDNNTNVIEILSLYEKTARELVKDVTEIITTDAGSVLLGQVGMYLGHKIWNSFALTNNLTVLTKGSVPKNNETKAIFMNMFGGLGFLAAGFVIGVASPVGMLMAVSGILNLFVSLTGSGSNKFAMFNAGFGLLLLGVGVISPFASLAAISSNIGLASMFIGFLNIGASIVAFSSHQTPALEPVRSDIEDKLLMTENSMYFYWFMKKTKTEDGATLLDEYRKLNLKANKESTLEDIKKIKDAFKREKEIRKQFEDYVRNMGEDGKTMLRTEFESLSKDERRAFVQDAAFVVAPKENALDEDFLEQHRTTPENIDWLKTGITLIEESVSFIAYLKAAKKGADDVGKLVAKEWEKISKNNYELKDTNTRIAWKNMIFNLLNSNIEISLARKMAMFETHEIFNNLAWKTGKSYLTTGITNGNVVPMEEKLVFNVLKGLESSLGFEKLQEMFAKFIARNKPTARADELQKRLDNDDWKYFKGEVESRLKKIKVSDNEDDRKLAKLGLFEFLNNINASKEKRNPVEGQGAALKGMSQLSAEDEKYLITLIQDEVENNPDNVSELMVSVLLAFNLETEDNVPGNWIEKRFSNLKGRKIWLISPEISIIAGGLGYVVQTRGRSYKKLGKVMEKYGFDIGYVEPMYKYKIVRNESSFYGDGVKPELINWDEIIKDKKIIGSYYENINGKDVKINIISATRIDDGISTLLIEEDCRAENSHFTRTIYNYNNQILGPDGNAIFKNPASWDDFSSFFSYGISEGLKKAEDLRRRDYKKRGIKFEPGIFWANDSQSVAGLTKIKNESYDKKSPLNGGMFNFICHTIDNTQGLSFSENLKSKGVDLKYWMSSQQNGGTHDVACLGGSIADLFGGVAWNHVTYMRGRYPNSKMSAFSNGDDVLRALKRVKTIYDELGFSKNKEFNTKTITDDEMIAIKKEAVKRYNDLMGFTGTDKELNPEKGILIYTGRLVDVKVGDYFFNPDVIRNLVNSGQQVVICSRLQLYDASRSLKEKYSKLEMELKQKIDMEIHRSVSNGENRKERKDYGKFIFLPQFIDDEKQALLQAATMLGFDSQVTYPFGNIKRTGANEALEANGPVYGTLVIAPDFYDTITGRFTGEGGIISQGLRDETILSVKSTPQHTPSAEDFTNQALTGLKLWETNRNSYAKRSKQSIWVSRCMNSDVTTLTELIAANDYVGEESNDAKLQDNAIETLLKGISTETGVEQIISGILETGNTGKNGETKPFNFEGVGASDKPGLDAFRKKKIEAEEKSAASTMYYLKDGHIANYIGGLLNNIKGGNAIIDYINTLRDNEQFNEGKKQEILNVFLKKLIDRLYNFESEGYQIISQKIPGDDNVSCGTICEDKHEGSYNSLDSQLNDQFNNLRNDYNKWAKANKKKQIAQNQELTENQADLAIVKSGFAASVKELSKLRAKIRIEAKIPDNISVYFSLPENGKDLFWIDGDYAAGHFNKAGTRIHISLSIALDSAQTAVGIARHELGHIEGKGHTSIEPTVASRIAVAVTKDSQVNKFDIGLLRNTYKKMGFTDVDNISESDLLYFNSLYKQYLEGKSLNLIIDKNFAPSARLTKAEREKFLGATEYNDLKKNEKVYRDAAHSVKLILNPLNGGLGTSLKRDTFLASIWDELINLGMKKKGSKPSLSAKGSDMFFDIEIKGKNTKISVSEVKILKALHEKDNYSGTIIKQLGSSESVDSINELLDTENLFGRLGEDSPYGKKSYRQIFEDDIKLKLEETAVVALFPGIDVSDNRKLWNNIKASGSHGQYGQKILNECLGYNVSGKETLIGAIYNEDGINNGVDPIIAGWMAKENIPIVMLSTTKSVIDKKGGQIGVELDVNGNPTNKKAMLELAMAKGNGQTDLFGEMGLTEGEDGAQYFNTNTVIINYTALVPFLNELKTLIGDEEYFRIIGPLLIKNKKEKTIKVDGVEKKVEYMQLEGALGTTMINLSNYVSGSNNQKIKDLLKKHKFDNLLRILNIDTFDRTRFFTPSKLTIDFWMLLYSDLFKLDTNDWELKTTNPGHLPSFDFGPACDGYYDDTVNVFNAFKDVKIKDLDTLYIDGKFTFAGAVMKGNVSLGNKSGKIFDLNNASVKQKLGLNAENPLILENVTIDVDENGNISVIRNDKGFGFSQMLPVIAGIAIGVPLLVGSILVGSLLMGTAGTAVLAGGVIFGAKIVKTDESEVDLDSFTKNPFAFYLWLRDIDKDAIDPKDIIPELGDISNKGKALKRFLNLTLDERKNDHVLTEYILFAGSSWSTKKVIELNNEAEKLKKNRTSDEYKIVIKQFAPVFGYKNKAAKDEDSEIYGDLHAKYGEPINAINYNGPKAPEVKVRKRNNETSEFPKADNTAKALDKNYVDDYDAIQQEAEDALYKHRSFPFKRMIVTALTGFGLAVAAAPSAAYALDFKGVDTSSPETWIYLLAPFIAGGLLKIFESAGKNNKDEKYEKMFKSGDDSKILKALNWFARNGNDSTALMLKGHIEQTTVSSVNLKRITYVLGYINYRQARTFEKSVERLYVKEGDVLFEQYENATDDTDIAENSLYETWKSMTDSEKAGLPPINSKKENQGKFKQIGIAAVVTLALIASPQLLMAGDLSCIVTPKAVLPLIIIGLALIYILGTVLKALLTEEGSYRYMGALDLEKQSLKKEEPVKTEPNNTVVPSNIFKKDGVIVTKGDVVEINGKGINLVIDVEPAAGKILYLEIPASVDSFVKNIQTMDFAKISSIKKVEPVTVRTDLPFKRYERVEFLYTDKKWYRGTIIFASSSGYRIFSDDPLPGNIRDIGPNYYSVTHGFQSSDVIVALSAEKENIKATQAPVSKISNTLKIFVASLIGLALVSAPQALMAKELFSNPGSPLSQQLTFALIVVLVLSPVLVVMTFLGHSLYNGLKQSVTKEVEPTTVSNNTKRGRPLSPGKSPADARTVIEESNYLKDKTEFTLGDYAIAYDEFVGKPGYDFEKRAPNWRGTAANDLIKLEEKGYLFIENEKGKPNKYKVSPGLKTDTYSYPKRKGLGNEGFSFLSMLPAITGIAIGGVVLAASIVFSSVIGIVTGSVILAGGVIVGIIINKTTEKVKSSNARPELGSTNSNSPDMILSGKDDNEIYYNISDLSANTIESSMTSSDGKMKAIIVSEYYVPEDKLVGRDDYDLYVQENGSNRLKYIKHSTNGPLLATWSPDGNALAIAYYNGLTPKISLWKRNKEGILSRHEEIPIENFYAELMPDKIGWNILGTEIVISYRETLARYLGIQETVRLDVSKVLGKSDTKVTNSRIAAVLLDKLMSEDAASDDIYKASDLVIDLHNNESNNFLIDQWQYPDSKSQQAEKALKSARLKYYESGNKKGFNGFSVVSNIDDRSGENLKELIKNVITNINKWQRENIKDKKIMATVALGSEHMTLYDGICDEELPYKDEEDAGKSVADLFKKWKGLEGYNKFNQLNEKTVKLIREELNKKSNPSIEEIRSTIYDVVQKRFSYVLNNFSENEIPVFKIGRISAFPPHAVGQAKSVIIARMMPATAKDLVLLTRIQDRIKEETGIENFGAFVGHVTLGYIVNEFANENEFKEFKKYLMELDDYLQKQSKSGKYVLKINSANISRFEDMDKFPPTESFVWGMPSKKHLDISEEYKIESMMWSPDNTKLAVILHEAYTNDEHMGNYHDYYSVMIYEKKINGSFKNVKRDSFDEDKVISMEWKNNDTLSINTRSFYKTNTIQIHEYNVETTKGLGNDGFSLLKMLPAITGISIGGIVLAAGIVLSSVLVIVTGSVILAGGVIVGIIIKKSTEISDNARPALGTAGPFKLIVVSALSVLMFFIPVHVFGKGGVWNGGAFGGSSNYDFRKDTGRWSNDTTKSSITIEESKKLIESANKSVPKLIVLLENNDATVRKYAAEALGDMGPAAKDSVPALVRLTRDSFYVANSAIIALGNIGSAAKSALPDLSIELSNLRLDSYSAPKCFYLAEAIYKISKDAKAVMPTFIKLLEENNDEIRFKTIDILGDIGPAAKAALPRLIYLINYEGAALTIGKINLPKLIDLLKSNDQNVVHHAFKGFKAMGPQAKTAVPVLIRMLNDENLGGYAIEVLESIGPAARDAVPVLIRMLKNGKYGTIEALGNIGPASKDAVPILIRLLNSIDSEVSLKVKIIKALGNIGNVAKPALPELTKLLKHQDLKYVAAESIYKITKNAKTVMPFLLELLNDTDADIRVKACEVIGNIGPDAKDAIPALVNLLIDKYPKVQSAAEDAIKKVSRKKSAGTKFKSFIIAATALGMIAAPQSLMAGDFSQQQSSFIPLFAMVGTVFVAGIITGIMRLKDKAEWYAWPIVGFVGFLALGISAEASGMPSFNKSLIAMFGTIFLDILLLLPGIFIPNMAEVIENVKAKIRYAIIDNKINKAEKLIRSKNKKRAYSYLINMYRSKNYMLHNKSIELFGKLGDMQAIEMLMESTDNFNLRANSLKTLRAKQIFDYYLSGWKAGRVSVDSFVELADKRAILYLEKYKNNLEIQLNEIPNKITKEEPEYEQVEVGSTDEYGMNIVYETRQVGINLIEIDNPEIIRLKIEIRQISEAIEKLEKGETGAAVQEVAKEERGNRKEETIEKSILETIESAAGEAVKAADPRALVRKIHDRAAIRSSVYKVLPGKFTELKKSVFKEMWEINYRDVLIITGEQGERLCSMEIPVIASTKEETVTANINYAMADGVPVFYVSYNGVGEIDKEKEAVLENYVAEGLQQKLFGISGLQMSKREKIQSVMRPGADLWPVIDMKNVRAREVEKHIGMLSDMGMNVLALKSDLQMKDEDIKDILNFAVSKKIEIVLIENGTARVGTNMGTVTQDELETINKNRNEYYLSKGGDVPTNVGEKGCLMVMAKEDAAAGTLELNPNSVIGVLDKACKDSGAGLVLFDLMLIYSEITNGNVTFVNLNEAVRNRIEALSNMRINLKLGKLSTEEQHKRGLKTGVELCKESREDFVSNIKNSGLENEMLNYLKNPEIGVTKLVAGFSKLADFDVLGDLESADAQRGCIAAVYGRYLAEESGYYNKNYEYQNENLNRLVERLMVEDKVRPSKDTNDIVNELLRQSERAGEITEVINDTYKLKMAAFLSPINAEVRDGKPLSLGDKKAIDEMLKFLDVSDRRLPEFNIEKVRDNMVIPALTKAITGAA